MFGKIRSYQKQGNTIHFVFENGEARVEVINAQIINLFAPLKYDDHYSTAIEEEKSIDCAVDMNTTGFATDCSRLEGVEAVTEACVEIKTESICAKVYDDFKVDFYDKNGNLLCEDYRKQRDPFVRRGNVSLAEEEGHKVEKSSEQLKIEIVKRMHGDEKFYGLGDKSGHLNKRGYGYEMWNTDDPSPHVESHKALYKTIPFFITLRKDCVFGVFFDNTFKSTFDMGKENPDYYWFGADDGNLDYYFISGDSIKDVLTGYTSLTGTTPLPQMWTLGYHQSRWSYAPESRLKEIAAKFKQHDLPCDVIHLDIDYMEDYKVFTWDKEKFADEQRTLAELKNDGFKVVTIIDPGVKKEKGYSIFETGMKNGYFATDKDGVTYVNRVWPGDSVYPDFSNEPTRTWWAQNQKIMMDSGVSGIWNDMNEPASFNGPLPDDVRFKNDGRETDHTEVHNKYGHLMSKATFEGIRQHTGKRPFVITRAAYAGTQKYSTVWTGDNQSFWEHLRMSIPMLLNLGMSGMGFCGTDVGGFGFDCTAELLSRWVQVGCFSPLFRNHSTIYSRDQEPWMFDKQTLDINRKYIKLRYQLLPYLYDLMWSGETTGFPAIRPLIMHYEQDDKVHEINDQFLFGENILVAPVVEQGKRARMVYLPAGTWFDYWTKEAVEGGRYIVREADLDTCPIYCKAGSIIPNYPDQSYVGQVEVKTLLLDIYPGHGQYVHYVDDKESYGYRDGEFTLYEFAMTANTETVIDICRKNYGYSGYEKFEIKFNRADVNEVLFHGKSMEFRQEGAYCVFTIPAEDGMLLIK